MASRASGQVAQVFGTYTLDYMVTSLEQMLAHFQTLGEFRPDFDPHAMAMAIRGAIDQAPPQLTRHPDLDIDSYARELVALFERATRQ